MATSPEDRPVRRQEPRVALDADVQCRLELRTRVRLLDISLTGALLGTDTTLPVGAKAHLRRKISPLRHEREPVHRLERQRDVRVNERPAAAHVPQRQTQHGLERPPQVADDVEARPTPSVTELPSHGSPWWRTRESRLRI